MKTTPSIRRIGPYAVMTALFGFFVFFLLLPVYTVVREGLRLPLLREIFTNFLYREGLLNSLAIAGVTTLLVFLIALPMALLYDRFNFPGKSLSHLAAMIPMILPPFVGALGFQQILGHYGVINTILVSLGGCRIDFLGGSGCFWSVCLIEALHLYPIFYLNVVTALGNLDPSLDEALPAMPKKRPASSPGHDNAIAWHEEKTEKRNLPLLLASHRGRQRVMSLLRRAAGGSIFISLAVVDAACVISGGGSCDFGLCGVPVRTR